MFVLFFLAEGILFGFGDNKSAQLGQGHQKPIMAKPVQVTNPRNQTEQQLFVLERPRKIPRNFRDAGNTLRCVRFDQNKPRDSCLSW